MKKNRMGKFERFHMMNFHLETFFEFREILISSFLHIRSANVPIDPMKTQVSFTFFLRKCQVSKKRLELDFLHKKYEIANFGQTDLMVWFERT